MKTIEKIKVRNLMSDRSNRSIPNQFTIATNKGVYFQSYASIIAFCPYDDSKPTLLDRKTWNYSRTTGKYRNIFLGETKKETERKIKAGIYKLVDLN